MRMLIAKLTNETVQSVSVALNSSHDVADLATDMESCVRMLRGSTYDMMVLITSHKRPHARDAIAKLRREVSRLPLIVLTEPGRPAAALPAAAIDVAGGAIGGGTWVWRDGVGWPAPVPAPGTSNGARLGSAGEVLGPRRITLESSGDTLRCGGRTVSLSQAEARLFARLWASRGEIVPVEALMAAIYGDAARPASRVLPVFLFKLRKKLALLGLHDVIETTVGRGFMIPLDPPIGPATTPARSHG